MLGKSQEEVYMVQAWAPGPLPLNGYGWPPEATPQMGSPRPPLWGGLGCVGLGSLKVQFVFLWEFVFVRLFRIELQMI